MPKPVRSPERQSAFFWDRFVKSLAKHDEHTWAKVGRCVYCVDCNTRLFNGDIPREHQNVGTFPTKPKQPDTATKMLELRKARYGE
jgi:hypothetical protein